MQSPARPTPKPDVAALVTEIMEEAKKSAEDPAPPPTRRVPSYVAAGIVMALCAWVWIAPPPWLLPPPAAGPSREYREASTRVALALHAQRIESFRTSHGRLPRTKQEVGISSNEVAYDRTDSVSYELTSRVDGQPVSYRSSQPRDRYLAEAMTALSRAPR